MSKSKLVDWKQDRQLRRQLAALDDEAEFETRRLAAVEEIYEQAFQRRMKQAKLLRQINQKVK